MSNNILLNADLFKRLQVAKIFKEEIPSKITSFGFHSSGEFCITSSEDESINLYDCIKGTHKKLLYSKKYGVNNIRFTHWQNAIIYSSTKVDDTIRYLSLHDNRYLMYFRGHESRVSSMEMSPINDTFLSSSSDSIRVWDLKLPAAIAMVKLESQTTPPLVAYDPQGLVFAVALNSNSIKLFDVKNLESGPFSNFNITDSFRKNVKWTAMSISNDGKDILISTDSGVIYLIDAFEGYIKSTFSGHLQTKTSSVASFTPDGLYVICGSEDGKIHVWDKISCQQVAVMEAQPEEILSFVEFNPKYSVMASCSKHLSLWIPDELT